MISDSVLRGYEKYLLSDRNLKEVLNVLPSNTEDSLFISLIHTLNTVGYQGIAKDKTMKEQLEYLKRISAGSRTEMIVLREALLKFDNATNEQERTDALNILKKYVGWNHDNSKPSNLKKIRNVQGEEAKGGDTSEEEDESTRKLPTAYTADLNLFTKDVLVNELIRNNNASQINQVRFLNIILQRYIPTLDFTKMTYNEGQFEYYLRDNIKQIDFESPSFDTKLKDLTQKYKDYPTTLNYVMNKYGCQGLIQLSKKFSYFKSQYLIEETTKRMFQKEFYTQDVQNYTLEKKREFFRDVEKFVSTTFGKDDDLVRTVTYAQIYLLYQENKFDEALFSQYVAKPHYLHYYFINEKNQGYNTGWNRFFQQFQRFDDNQQNIEVIQANLENQYIVKKVDIMKKYSKIFREEYLASMKATFDYLNNLKMDTNQYVQPIVNQLQNATYIKLCYYNKTQFGVEEEIEIFSNIKNVQKLKVKVFEVNTDNYFRKNMSPFTSDINLDGLVAKYEQDYSYTEQPSNQQHTEQFFFPQFNGKRGLYVFEFIGNGISSRAVVQKGNLSLIYRSTIAGHIAFLLDESKNICKGEYTGIYFDDNFYKADKENGRIIIPFGRHRFSGKAILINEGFAQLSNFDREDENYNFDANFVLHNESVTMGNMAKILIKPTLILNNREIADLRLLENTKITIQTVNQVDNITTSKTFEDVKLSSDEEYELEFQVPPNIATINVTVNTQVNVISKTEKRPFAKHHIFTVNNHSNDYDFCEVFLRNVGGDYQLMVRGKNGEPKSRCLFDVQLRHKFYYQVKSILLKTDKQGIINLGKLKNITHLTATPRSSRILRQVEKGWSIPERNHFTYPTDVTLLESESIKLPFAHKTLKTTNFKLIQLSPSGVYVENRFTNAKLVVNKGNAFVVNYLDISGLKEGQYQITLKKENTTITIQVLEGTYWKFSKDFIIKERGMIERKEARIDTLRIDNLEIENVKVEEEEAKTIQRVKVTLGGNFNKSKARIHAWAFKFFPYELKEQITDKLGYNGGATIMDAKNFNFAKWQNMYLSNRSISDENRYIMERQSQEAQIGIFLEKPTVLLKRNYIRDTTFSQEQLNQGSNYDKIQADYGGGGVGGMMYAAASKRMMDSAAYHRVIQFKGIEGFQNFLQHSAGTALNVKAVETHHGLYGAEFDLNLDPYTTLLVVATSEEQSSHLLLPLQSSQIIAKRDLSLLQAYEVEKSFSETRRTDNCFKYDSFIIEDITSTDMQIVDSLNKVWLVMKELKRFNNDEQEFIEYLLKWPTLTKDQRAKNYSEYCSHEFNVFLKMKDPSYFEEVVRPFLTNKIEKTFVDYWLLEYDEAINHFIEPHKLKLLNVFEQCLLIHFLVQKDNKQRAGELSQSIRDSTQTPSIDFMNRIYDTVLNMNSLNSKPSDGKFVINETISDLDSLMQNEKKKLLEEKKMKLEKLKAEKEMRSQSKQLESREKCSEMDEKKSMRESSPAEKNMRKRKKVKEEEVADSEVSSSQQIQDLLLMDHSELMQVRQEQKLAFKEMDNTKEYAETQYYKIKERKESKNLIAHSMFWADLSKSIVDRNGDFLSFLSSYFTLALQNINEAALALAFIDLPFKDESHGFKANLGRGIEIKAAANIIVFLKEIQEAPTQINKDLLVVHRYFEKDKQEREVEEFLVDEVYACQVIITNISNKTIKFQALNQIPEGALPVYKSHYQKSNNHTLSAFSTMQFTFYFYFPSTGHFDHFPTNISIDRVVVAKAVSSKLKVQRVQTKINEDDFDDILATGSIPNILHFMKTKNIVDPEVGFKFSNIYWLCKDKTFYQEGIQILKAKNIYDQQFWAYSILHNDLENMREFFCSDQANLKRRVGSQFESGLVQVNNYEDSHDIFNFLDYYPLVNARAHRLGGMDSSSNNSSSETKKWILNEQMNHTYKVFVVYMVSKRYWTPHDRLMFVNYLLMQERVSEAVAEFKKIEGLSDMFGEAQIQYDYIRAFLDFYECGKSGSLDFKDARSIVVKYSTYPVLHWRKLFKEIEEQLKEIDESYREPEEAKEEVKFDNLEDTEQERKRKQVKTEPQLDFIIEDKALNIDYQNVESVTVNYYRIDLEILFSKTPFLNSDTQDFSFVQPFASEELWLDQNQSNFKFPIPEDLAKKNLLIEITNQKNGLKQLNTYYSATLRVRVIENYGELKVFVPNSKGQDLPLPKTYVKVYQRKAGNQVTFFKDGYTDLRGRFDYGQLSGTSIADVERFSIFVSNSEYGSLIKEAKPPSGLKK